MKRLTLYRDTATNTEITGRLVFGDQTLYTIERPWVPDLPGGKPFRSCVPAGTYEIVMHTRGNGDVVPALVNCGLGVYYTEMDRIGGIGRYKILIHSGNWVKDVVGCIAPGLNLTDSNQGPMVTSSKSAMKAIMEYIGDDEAEIEIVGDNRYE